MDTLPRELLDAVLHWLADYDFPDSARFPVLDDASRQSILNARLVGRCFCYSKTLSDLFIAVLEETPFMWVREQTPNLLEVSRSKLAGQMKTLSLCGMNNPSAPSRWATPNITRVLRRFVSVRHLRYYPISPKCFRTSWPGRKFKSDVGPARQWGYPPDNDVIHSWLSQQEEPEWICGMVMNNIINGGLALESVTFPLFGNRASYCGIQVATAHFPSALKRLTVSLTDRYHDIALFEPWLVGLRNLTFLEVAISRNPDSLRPWSSFASCRRLVVMMARTAREQLPRLEELRLMADNQICFSEHDLLTGLDMFPNLRKLGLAHILIKSQLNNATSWESFIKQLIPRHLERLWLLDPRNLWTGGHMGHAGSYRTVKYKADDSFRAVANQVRLIDTNSIWAEGSEPPKRRDFDYPGFVLFEQTSVGRPL
ncbi:hypothetical protein OPT61_g7113 [Boeremia exigua]|uniref:Uncharacterized protein n=1 Tax=Boeremia exigua TaxID=749465 RepID=A0ACC2I3P4_9PLEO|nr:hypothetical protein OPT61_g7113 [Boeremia exigua]